MSDTPATTTGSDALSIGMLGYRFMGQAHTNALDRLPLFFPDAPDIEKAVLVGRDEAALTSAADRLGFARTATDWEAVVGDVDVFYNLGPNHLHVDPSIAALEAGTNVLCEKPLAPTLAEAERMRDAARGSEARSACAFNYRFVPAIQYAKRLIEAGELGTIRHVRGRYLQDWLVDPEAAWSWRLDGESAGSGTLGDLGAHTIDLVRFLVGEETGGIDRVDGHLRTFVDERPVDGSEAENGSGETRPVTVDDAFSAHLEFANGQLGTVEASRVATGHKNDHTIAIEGTEGGIRFSLERLNELEVIREDGRGYETVLVTDPDDPYIDAWWPPGHVLGWEHTFIHENFEFLSAIASGTEFHPSFEDGYATQRVLSAIADSDDRNERVTLD